MDETSLKKIKKDYGENFARLCRSLFPTLLETDGLLYQVISKAFTPNHSLFSDITTNAKEDQFKSYIFSFVDVESKNKAIITKSPKQLFGEAGYTLYDECKTEDDVQSYKKFYADGEALCTFNGGRLNSNRVWFAVKKNVGEIKRENFKNPTRQDLYGTSVISIQFTRVDNVVSIKNRYNHTVNNPDATFSNNLDSIVAGLTESFAKTYDLQLGEIKVEFELPNYVKANDGLFCKYNFEKDNIYYCPNNVIIDNFEVKKYDKSRYLIIDNFIIDKQTKTVKSYDGSSDIGFESFESLIEEKLENGKKKLIIKPQTGKEIFITLNENSEIIEYKNENLTSIGNNFMSANKACEKIELPNATTIGDFFLQYNTACKEIGMSKVTIIGDGFMAYNKVCEKVELQNVTTIGDGFMTNNKACEKIELPSVTTIGSHFLRYNTACKEIYMANVTTIGNHFMESNEACEKIELPNATTIGDYFLQYNTVCKEIYMANVTTIGDDFMKYNIGCDKIFMPEVTTIGNSFIKANTACKIIEMPNVTTIGKYFMDRNKVIEKIEMPNIIIIGEDFLGDNEICKEIYMPKVKTIGTGFMTFNTDCEKIYMPKVTTISEHFMNANTACKEIYMPKITEVGVRFMDMHKRFSEMEPEKLRNLSLKTLAPTV